MSVQAIVDRIIADAETKAAATEAEARAAAEKMTADTLRGIERDKAGVAAEVNARTKAILDGKAATARLDCAKILLAEKRRVLDEVYAQALKGLKNLERPKAVALAARLLGDFAEVGDEIVFADGYKYRDDVANLPVVAEKKLKVAVKTADIDGGFVLSGKNSDKDLSYGALLAADREERQAEIAAKIFGGKPYSE